METSKEENGKVKHCHIKCKFKGEDEKHGEMIECCLCKTWHHVDCLDKEGKPKESEMKSRKDKACKRTTSTANSQKNGQERLCSGLTETHDSIDISVKKTQEKKISRRKMMTKMTVVATNMTVKMTIKVLRVEYGFIRIV